MMMLRADTRSIDQGICNQAIELGPAIIKNIDLKLPEAKYHMFLPCLCWFDLSVQNILLIGLAISQNLAEAMNNLAATEKLEISLLAHAINGNIEDDVLHSPSGNNMCWYNFTTLWLIGRQGDNICALQSQDPRMLRELGIEADAHPDPAHLCLVDTQR